MRPRDVNGSPTPRNESASDLRPAAAKIIPTNK